MTQGEIEIEMEQESEASKAPEAIENARAQRKARKMQL